MKIRIPIMLVVITYALCISAEGQESSTLRKVDCVSFQMVSQRAAPAIIDPAPEVIVLKPDDLQFRFELKNKCEQTIYYEAYANLDKEKPAGFMIYRSKGEGWRARSPAWHREGSLTGVGYKWVSLKSGENVEFEASDLSSIDGERSFSTFVNYGPTQDDRIELNAMPFNVGKP